MINRLMKIIAIVLDQTHHDRSADDVIRSKQWHQSILERSHHCTSTVSLNVSKVTDMPVNIIGHNPVCE